MHAEPLPLRDLLRTLRRSSRSTWHVVHLGALALTLALAPSSYRAPWRAPLAAQMVRAALPLLPWFTLLASIVGLVVIRIVLVTAESYGLSQYALGLLVRVLVLELIPLSAAMTVALRVTMPMAAELACLRVDALARGSLVLDERWLREHMVPRVLAGGFGVLLLAAVSSLLALVLAYVLAYGFTPFAFGRFTRLVGQVFDPVISLVFVLKTAALALAVSVVPIASAVQASMREAGEQQARGAMRLFVLVLAIEIVALAGNYLR
ncbi:MAG TPA: ABC transporter permease [Rubrivivax sp.]|nr:ABC transporter permease [Burkholderiales bacterium]HNU10211.1 ABC transporter permease [Rubrivivax sp.]